MKNKTIVYRMFQSGEKEASYILDNGENVYSRLAYELRAHYIYKAAYIRRIVDRNNYDGTRTITVYYDTGKGVYNIPA